MISQGRGMVKMITALFFVVMFSGCTSNPPRPTISPLHPLEVMWQCLHVIDVLQTANGVVGRDKCVREENPLTRRIIGAHPSDEKVYMWGLGAAITHYLISEKMNNTGATWAIRGFDVAHKFNIVKGNDDLGLTISGRRRHLERSCKGGPAATSPALSLTWRF